MDELELNLDTVSDADANLEVEGAEAQIEDIQNRYPDEDYRTPEQQALEAEQAERAAEDARLRELYPLPEDDQEYGEEQYEREDFSDNDQLDTLQDSEISSKEERKR